MGWLGDFLTRTPRYKGKNLREWLTELTPTPAGVEPAVNAFHAIGPQGAVPALIRLLADEYKGVRCTR
jgi:hypothetical protein